MLKIKKLLIFIIFISFLTITGVNAEIQIQTYNAKTDFYAHTPESIKVCACSETKDYITITNTGSFPSIFYINTEIQISENSFELKSGETKQVMLFLKPGCNPRTKTYDIIIKNNLGVEKKIQKQINIERCQNLELRVKSTNQTYSCQNTEYTLFITNTGSFVENYKIKSNYDNLIEYSSNYLTLNPQQTAEVKALMKIPCEMSGDKKIRFSVYSVNNRLEANYEEILKIIPDYDFIFYINEEASDFYNLETCNRVWNTQIPIKITNNGIDNTFTIIPNKFPKFVKISETKFNLARGESKIVYLNIDTHNYRNEINNYDFSIIIKPKTGNQIQKNIRLTTKPCFEHTIQIIDESTEKNPIKTCAEGFYEYDVKITNKGIYSENIKLYVSNAPSGVDLSEYNINLNPDETKNVKLYIQGPNTNYLYNIKVNAELTNQLSESDNIWMQAYDKEKCHEVEFKKSNYRINYDTKYIELPVTSKGLYQDYYDLYLNDTKLLGLEETNLFIGNSSKIKINVYSKDVPEGEYFFKIYAEHYSGAKYEYQIKINLKDKSSIRKAFEYFIFGNECKKTSLASIIAIIILVLIIIVFLIKGPNYPYKLKNRVIQKMPVLIVLIIIFVVASLLVMLFADKPKTYNEIYNLNSSIKDLRFEILENEKYVLDASQFFSDPDKNKLRYEVSKIKNVRTSIKNNLITLIPDYGWSGERIFTITAYDDQGGMTESPEMTIKVVDVPRKSVLQLYEIYCWYTNLLLLLIILLLIFIAFIVKQKRRVRKK